MFNKKLYSQRSNLPLAQLDLNSRIDSLGGYSSLTAILVINLKFLQGRWPLKALLVIKDDLA
uniref:Uncharacterized protein n=1 Tax=Populus trichocarpa TaxID=3694 RepID=A0A3N7FH16_POPTR